GALGCGVMLRRGLVVAAIAVVLDQASKAAVLAHFNEIACARHGEVVTPFLDLVLTCNTGVSFGLFSRSGLNALLFSIAAVIVVLILVFWLKRVQSNFLAVA